MRRDVVVIGTSAGGIDALRILVAALPADFPAAVCVVLHTAPDSPGILKDILNRAGPVPAVTVKGTEKLVPGRIYVADADQHLLVEPSKVCGSRGPRENRFRPAIDPLFRSAARAYGPRVIGVILTGGLDDGTAGLWAVKRLGGIAVVQDPKDAIAPSMPQSALAHVEADHCVPLAEIAPLLVRLTSESIEEAGGYVVPDPIDIEVKIANASEPLQAGVTTLGPPSAFACPECHGVLRELKEGERVRFRCHTGHAYSSEALLSEIDDNVEIALWNSVRALHEKVFLMRQLAENARTGDPALADQLRRRADIAFARAEIIRQATLHEAPPRDAPRGGNGSARTSAD